MSEDFKVKNISLSEFGRKEISLAETEMPGLMALRKEYNGKSPLKGAKILVMGLTFKENCADIRNSGIQSVITKLKKFDCNLDLYDPWADRKEIKETYNISPQSKLNKNAYDGIIIAVAHKKFKKMGIKAILNLCKNNHVIYDLKYLFSKNQIELRL